MLHTSLRSECRAPSRSASAHLRCSTPSSSQSYLFPYNQKLLPEDAPRERETQICGDKKGWVLRTIRHGKRQEFINAFLYDKPGFPKGLRHGLFSKWESVVFDFPVRLPCMSNVWPERNKTAT